MRSRSCGGAPIVCVLHSSPGIVHTSAGTSKIARDASSGAAQRGGGKARQRAATKVQTLSASRRLSEVLLARQELAPSYRIQQSSCSPSAFLSSSHCVMDDGRASEVMEDECTYAKLTHCNEEGLSGKGLRNCYQCGSEGLHHHMCAVSTPELERKSAVEGRSTDTLCAVCAGVFTIDEITMLDSDQAAAKFAADQRSEHEVSATSDASKSISARGSAATQEKTGEADALIANRSSNSTDWEVNSRLESEPTATPPGIVDTPTNGIESASATSSVHDSAKSNVITE
eukprot:6214646-Pleurochrysis_carterae.AAC.1